MYKLILHDYVQHFKESFKKTNCIPWLIDFYWIFPCCFFFQASINKWLIYFLSIIPFTFSILLSRMYGGKMSKTFYLCPLSKEQRKNYIKSGIKLRVILSATLYILLNFIPMILGMILLWVFVAQLLLLIFSAACYNMYCQPTIKTIYAMQRKYPLKGNYEIRNFFAIITGGIGTVILIFTEGNEHGFELIVVFAPVLIQLFLCIDIYRKFYNQILDQSEFYDTIA